jgi:hypothetical protein
VEARAELPFTKQKCSEKSRSQSFMEGKTMKFLGIAKPPAAVTGAMIQAVRERYKSNIKSGVSDCGYFFANGSRAISITNADSAEELAQRMLANGWPPLESEVYPLVEFDKYLERVSEALKKQAP